MPSHVAMSLLPGTYNNQYMVLDLKKIHLKMSIEDNALWVVEQIPGYELTHSYITLMSHNLWNSQGHYYNVIIVMHC